MLNKVQGNIIRFKQKVESAILSNKTVSRVVGIMTFMLMIATPVYAAPQIGQNSATYILEQVSWAILAGAIILAVKTYMKGNTARAIIWIVVGGVLFVICKNPTKLQSFGNWVFEILGI